MFDRLWDLFVNALITLFMPLVCSYFTLNTNLFLNASIEGATGLERAGNVLLAPVHYLCAGREVVKAPNGEWSFEQRFEYEERFWPKTIASTLALVPSAVLGSAVKGIAFVDGKVRGRHREVALAWQSTAVHSNLSLYREMGIPIGELEEALPFLSQGHLRRPGDEGVLREGKEALKEIGALLNEAGIPWWVDCGTCLGAYRYGGVIPWDEDIDIAVLLPDFENVRRALNRLDPEKYVVQDWSSRSLPHTYLKVYVRSTATLIDIYHFAIDAEKRELTYILSLENGLFFPEWWKVRERRFKVPTSFETVFPLKKGLFDGVEVFLPNQIEAYLQRYYGENLDPAKVYDPVTQLYEKDLSHPYWQKTYVH